MVRIFNIFFRLILLGIILGFLVIYITHPNSIFQEETHECKEIQTIYESTVEEEDAAEEDDTSENYFCSEFKSKGRIICGERKVKPGMLIDVTEIAVANDSIFFLETSCAEDLNPRQSCAVESAARTNLEKEVYVLFLSPDASLGPDGGQNIRKLKSIYTNIHFYYIDIINYAKRTKMEKWVANQTLITSSYRVAHLSDGLRLLTLCRYGGIYLDLDVVVMHSLLNMSNFAGDDGYGGTSNGVMGMKANGSLVNACLDEFVNDYRGNLWSYNGPLAVNRALQKSCKRITRRLWENCDGTFVLYPQSSFYPIHYSNWKLYFTEANNDKIAEIINNSILIHVWNKLSKNHSVKVGSNALYGVIASKYCPLSYWNSAPLF